MHIRKLSIKHNQICLAFHKDELNKVILKGDHYLPATAKRVYEVYDRDEPRFKHDQLLHLSRNPLLEPYLSVINLAKHQLGLVWFDGKLLDVIGDGRFGFWKDAERLKVEIFDKLQDLFQHRLLQFLVDEPKLAEHLEVVDLPETERAAVWRDGRLIALLAPGLHAFWKDGERLVVERFAINHEPFAHKRLQQILQDRNAGSVFETTRVEAGFKTLLLHDGKLDRVLEPGLYAFFLGLGRRTFKQVDTRETGLDVTGQDIMTRDKVTLRMNLLVNFKITDVVKAAVDVSDVHQAVYREAQLALRAAVGVRQLDELLADKESVGEEVRDVVRKRAENFGVTITSIGVRDIILPGDMKQLLNQVTEARKEAEANLIRRREETAAARSQANTARLLAENPHLARMKELEMVQEILAGANVRVNFGDGDLRDQLSEMFLGKANS